MPPVLQFHPPLVNSACPWATDLPCLKALLESPSTGAVTTRTSLLAGFDHQPQRHRFTFFDPAAPNTPDGDSYSFPDEPGRSMDRASAGPEAAARHTASLNTLGYSPIPLQGYLDIIRQLAVDFPSSRKTFIVSVTGSPEDIAACYDAVAALAGEVHFPLALEVNLSCPNIPGRPPPAYDPASLRLYMAALSGAPAIPVGIKTPPYTHAGQYQTLISTLAETGAGGKLSFITSTNTLGSCLVLGETGGGSGGGGGGALAPILPIGDSGGIGGMAGPPLHPLALGNVATIRKMLDECDGDLRRIVIVGVGGVSDGGGYRRMRAVGASMVAVGTGLGSEGVDVFAKIESDIESKW